MRAAQATLDGSRQRGRADGHQIMSSRRRLRNPVAHPPPQLGARANFVPYPPGRARRACPARAPHRPWCASPTPSEDVPVTTRTLAAAALAATILGAGTARAQGATPAAPPLTPAQLIASAVLPLPPALREGATVLRLEGTGATSVLRRGAGAMICLTDSPTTIRFHVACYHRDLEPFMARG